MGFNKGLVLVYTGDGKGKTTAALGLALRAVGHGMRVLVVQFMKGSGNEYGEVKAAERLSENLKIVKAGRDKFVKHPPEKEDVIKAQEGLALVREGVRSGEWDMVILDEVNVALNFGLLGLSDVLDVVINKPANMTLVLTGRSAPDEIIDIADMASEVRELKHHFRDGIPAQPGIEY